MKKMTLPLAAAATLFAITGQAAHATNATASTSYALTLRVIDLTPGDNSAAGYTLQEYSGSGGSLRIGPDYDHSWISDSYSYPTVQSGNLAGRYGGITASVLGGPSAGGTSVNMAADSLDGQTFASTFVDWRLVLAPNTALVISGRYDIAVGLGQDDLDPSTFDAFGAFSLRGSTDDSGQGGVSDFYVRNEYGRYEWEEGSTGSTFSYSLANTTDASLNASLSFYAYVEAHKYLNSTLPVPEPATYMMLGVGLAIARAAARRRRAA